MGLWAPVNRQRLQQTETRGAFTPRHGTVIGITMQELERLQKAFEQEINTSYIC